MSAGIKITFILTLVLTFSGLCVSGTGDGLNVNFKNKIDTYNSKNKLESRIEHSLEKISKLDFGYEIDGKLVTTKNTKSHTLKYKLYCRDEQSFVEFSNLINCDIIKIYDGMVIKLINATKENSYLTIDISSPNAPELNAILYVKKSQKEDFVKDVVSTDMGQINCAKTSYNLSCFTKVSNSLISVFEGRINEWEIDKNFVKAEVFNKKGGLRNYSMVSNLVEETTATSKK